MSTEHGHQPATEPEHFESGKVVGVAVAAVLVFAVGSAWALRIRASTERAMNPAGRPAIPARIAAEEQGIVDVVPFELNRWVEKDRRDNGARLKGYAWVDRNAGVIRVPIERAMDLVVEESRK